MQSKLSDSLFKNGDFKIMPYVEVNGARTVPDNDIQSFWTAMQHDGLVKGVFYNGQINSYFTFLEFLKESNNIAIASYYLGNISGIAWLNNFNELGAQAHFIFLKSVWGPPSVTFANMILRYWDQFDMINVLIGVTPEYNRKAIGFIKRLGFKSLGVIPDALFDVYRSQPVGMSISYKKLRQS